MAQRRYRIPTIETLTEDIRTLIVNGLENVPEELIKKFSDQTALHMSERLKRERREFTLRFSNIGTPCARRLWLEKNFPEDIEPLEADALLKFSFGDLTEEYLLFLAELAGHEVLYRQHEVELNGIKGHWDAIIDGMLIDVKSASSNSFQKFKNGLTPETDAFGYLTQLGSYHNEAKKLEEVIYKDHAAFLAFDKQHGHITLDIHSFEDKDYAKFFEERKQIVDGKQIPERAFEPEPEGKSGNMKLPVNCSYCPLKQKCYEGKLRTFLYKRGNSYFPVYLTKVVREPKVDEV